MRVRTRHAAPVASRLRAARADPAASVDRIAGRSRPSAKGTATGRPCGQVGAQGIASRASSSARCSTAWSRSPRRRAPWQASDAKSVSAASALRALGSSACVSSQPSSRPRTSVAGSRPASSVGTARTTSVSAPKGSRSKPNAAAAPARLGEPGDLPGGRRERERDEQALALDLPRPPGCAQALEEHALVRGVLIDEQQAVLRLEHEVGREQRAEQPQLAEAQRRKRLRRARGRGGCGVRGRSAVASRAARRRASRRRAIRCASRAAARTRSRASPGREPTPGLDRGGDPVAHQAVQRRRIGEAHLPLRRMHVHVDGLRRQLDEEHRCGKASARQPVAVDLDQRVLQRSIAHGAPVHVQMDPRERRAMAVGARDEARQRRGSLAMLDRGRTRPPLLRPAPPRPDRAERARRATRARGGLRAGRRSGRRAARARSARDPRRCVPTPSPPS